MRRALALLATLAALTASAAPRQRAIRAETPAAWLHAHAFPLTSVEPSADDADLAPLLPLVANARIIALGDATHGTHEFFAIKQRIIPYLVRNANVRTILIEGPFGEFEKVRDYVRTGQGDLSTMLRSDDYFFWNAEEVLDVIRWARAWNAAGNPPIEIMGVDAFHAQTSVERLLSLLDPETRAEVAPKMQCVAALAGTTAEWFRTSCHESVMSVRPMLEAKHASFDVLFAARVAEQGEERHDRDSAMAENIERLAQRTGSGNVIVWGHNMHFGKLPYRLYMAPEKKSAGAMLAERFGETYVSIGTIALKGMFNAMEFAGDSGNVSQFPMIEAAPDDYASIFATASMPRMIVPLRGALASWLALPHPMRIAGSNIISREMTTFAFTEELARRFDAVIYIETSTATKLRQ
jgi:erythromycin esterase